MGRPPLRAMFLEFDERRFMGVDDQFLIGSALLVTPVLKEGEITVTGYFPSPGGVTWRDWYTHRVRV